MDYVLINSLEKTWLHLFIGFPKPRLLTFVGFNGSKVTFCNGGPKIRFKGARTQAPILGPQSKANWLAIHVRAKYMGEEIQEV